MEYFDIVDENGNPTGQTKPRQEVHRDGDWHKAAHVWIINSQNQLLIQKRSSNKDSHPNMWDISSAGHILAGDALITTAIKEAKEELGIDLQEKDFEYLFTLRSQKVLNEGAFINNELDDVYLVKLDLDISKLNIQKEELSEVKFTHFAELEKIINSDDKNFVSHPEEYKKLFSELHKRYD
ncbi:MAG: NUDIX domain-containing protein [Candidatus Paceibacterota bacterium]